MLTYLVPYFSKIEDPALRQYLLEQSGRLPLWYLENPFGKMVFVMVFLTWGLIIIALCLVILYLVRELFRKK